VDGGRRLRLASFAPSAPGVHAYRTQPGSATLVASAAPLNFRAVTRYFDGALGSWSVVISHAGTTDTLLATGRSCWAMSRHRPWSCSTRLRA